VWVFYNGPEEFRIPKTIPGSVGEKIAPQWPVELGTELLLRDRECDSGTASLSVKS
jgi:hypothetical protein